MKKKCKEILRRCALLALTAALFLPIAGEMVTANTTVAAVTKAEIDALKSDANKLAAEKKELASQLKEIRADKSQAQSQKNLLEQQINVIQSEIDNIDGQIDKYDELINVKLFEVNETQARTDEQYELFCRRIRAMEEEGETSYWSIILGSSSFAEMLDNFMMVEEIISYDNSVMDALMVLKQKLETEQKELEDARSEQEAAKAAQVAAQDELKDRQSEVSDLIKEISTQEDKLEAAEAALKKEAAAMDAQIKKLEQQYASQIAKVPSESGYLWPLPASYNTLSSLYGNRIHPITRKPNNHTGIDLPAPAGTHIYAAKSGVITTSTYNRSYGNYVMVSHSDGSSTLYAHMSKRNATQGATVKQGAVIGYVGTTGSSTGNHLHYEVRVNGNRTDPVNYYRDKTLYARASGKTVLLKH